MTMTQVDSWFYIPSTMHFSMIKKIRHFVEIRDSARLPMSWVDFKTVQGIIDDLIVNSILDDIVLRRMIERVFEEFRWEVKFNAVNDIISIEFIGEKEGNDKDFFDVIAPFVENESYIELDFEDYSCARWEFNGSECVERIGRYKRVWD